MKIDKDATQRAMRKHASGGVVERLEVPINVVIDVHVPGGNAFAMTNGAFQRMAQAAARHLRDGHNATEDDPAHRIATDVVQVKMETEATAPNVRGHPQAQGADMSEQFEEGLFTDPATVPDPSVDPDAVAAGNVFHAFSEGKRAYGDGYPSSYNPHIDYLGRPCKWWAWHAGWTDAMHERICDKLGISHPKSGDVVNPGAQNGRAINVG